MSTRPHRHRTVAALAAIGLAGLVLPSAAHAADGEGTELLSNPGFDGTMDPWWVAGGVAFTENADGAMCGTVPGGGNQWDVIVGQSGIPVTAGDTFTVSVAASASPAATARVIVPDPAQDWPPLYYADVTLGADGQGFTEAFEVAADADSQVQLQVGGNPQDFELCLDEVSLKTGGGVAVYEPDTGPRVRVNQVGYLPDGPKRATLVSDATDPVPWELRDASGAVVAEGESTPAGLDPSAGLNVHTIDFSDVEATGSGLTLTADGETSYPFAIDAGIYDRLRADAPGIFYTQRSGMEIVPVEVDGELLKSEYARPAGHASTPESGDVNKGDVDIPCLPPSGVVDASGNPAAGADDHYGADGFACPEGYTVDASRGWYDAGDMGKYVVNGGISVYQLLATYERTLTADRVTAGALADSTLVVPERGNGTADILDEVRWELDFMLGMQVPDGTTMTIDGEQLDAGGLVHHKVTDVSWTGLNLLPSEDAMPRYVHRPSTAATLNLAAAAAQAARLFEDVDPAYADTLLAAARRAWDAAAAHPAIFAPNSNNLPNPGGGPYDDTQLDDERYWAAAELFLTTGDAQYRDAVLTSAFHVGGAQADIWQPTGFGWQFTAAAGRLDLATVPSDLPGRDDVVASVVEGADRYVAVQQAQPFGQAYGPDRYSWGSNHQVVNNAVVIATAYDLTGDEKYRTSALESFDYLLGRNAINNSYVTGYGTHFSQHMHNRWMASADRLPPHPDGMLAGGANSEIQDPVAQKDLQGCAPQFCYIDDVESWSTNEMTINWNAPLAWFASWADDMSQAAPEPEPGCRAEVRVVTSWGAGYLANVKVTAGPEPITGWSVGLPLAPSTVGASWSARVTASDGGYTAANETWNGALAAGASTEFGFLGTGAPPQTVAATCAAR